MIDAMLLKGTDFWTMVFFDITAQFIKEITCQGLSVKITATVRYTNLFNEAINNLLCDGNLKNLEKSRNKQ